MSDVAPTETTEAVSTPLATPPEPKKENADPHRGRRGEVGPHNIKGLFHSFQRREKRHSRGVSLKAFAHQTAENGTDEEKIVALDWLKNKAGALVKKDKAARQTAKGSTLAAIRLASKQARKGK